ncbi:MAG: hypothetical protein KAW12_01900 [Candidatus Aminicenantes bacterium]|nr:hypothetical protein [Candidatus Aminicenantes bacterium]
MTSTIEIDNRIYKALIESFGQEVLKEKINTFIISALENQLEKYSRDILKFEKKYGIPFYEFEKMWDQEKIENRHRYEIEGDFIDWEMMEMEKRELLSAMSKLRVHNTR